MSEGGPMENFVNMSDTEIEEKQAVKSYAGTGVLMLENFDFDEKGNLIPSMQNPNAVYLVKIFAHWCGHCKRFVGNYAKFSLMNKNNPKIKVCAINCTGQGTRKSEQDLAKRLQSIIPDFQGFPTVVAFKNGKLAGTFENRRYATELNNFANSILNSQ
jgi:thiol-disulfide isomerase/thioredoxin